MAFWKDLKRAADDRTRGWRGKPFRQRPSLPVEEFAAAAGLPNDPQSLEHIRAIRRVLGRFYGLPEGSFHPDDTRGELRQLTGKEPDAFELMMLVEAELGRAPGETSLAGIPDPRTVGEMVQAVLEPLSDANRPMG